MGDQNYRYNYQKDYHNVNSIDQFSHEEGNIGGKRYKQSAANERRDIE